MAMSDVQRLLASATDWLWLVRKRISVFCKSSKKESHDRLQRFLRIKIIVGGTMAFWRIARSVVIDLLFLFLPPTFPVRNYPSINWFEGWNLARELNTPKIQDVQCTCDIGYCGQAYASAYFRTTETWKWYFGMKSDQGRLRGELSPNSTSHSCTGELSYQIQWSDPFRTLAYIRYQ